MNDIVCLVRHPDSEAVITLASHPGAHATILPRATPSTTSRSPLDRLRHHLDRVTATRRRRGLPAPQVLVHTRQLDFAYGDLETPFHGASIGKVMTAVLIAQLAERRQLDFHTPLGEILPATEVADLPAGPGADVGRDVTVDHLLSHTAGLPDYFDPPRGVEAACSMARAAAAPDRYWSPADLLDEVRQMPPVGAPGERFHYSDTAYVLLGRIAEEATGESLSSLLRTRIFEPSGMDSASTPFIDARTTADLHGLDIAPMWLKRTDVSRALSLSIDWAGGGIVAKAGDFARFQRALQGGRLIGLPLVRHMERPRNRMRPGIHYGMGFVTVKFNGFMPLLWGLPQPTGGLGLTAAHLFYYREQDAHVVLNFHATGEMSRSFQTHIQIARILGQM